MKNGERFLNISLGASIIYWGIAGVVAYYTDSGSSWLRFFTAGLNITVGTLIIFRMPIIEKAGVRATLISLPSLICGGLLFKLAMPFNNWHQTSQLLLVLGCLITIYLFYADATSPFCQVYEILCKRVLLVLLGLNIFWRSCYVDLMFYCWF